MIIGIPKESFTGEKRVAASPKSVTTLIKMGFVVHIEKQAGFNANFSNGAYQQQGAGIVDKASAWQADLVLKVNAPTDEEIALMKPGATLVSFIAPAQNPALLQKLSEANITVLAMDAVPRISRAQALDALSSMANIAGYRAVIEASHHFGRFFSGQITAAGKIPPAKVMIIGAGVAGLAAIGAAGSLGAIVRAFDTRIEVKEQIESMGGTFLELDYEEETDSSDGYAKEMSKAFIEAEMALFMEQAKEVDIIITTAMIPGKPAPKLITAEMVQAMQPGSIIVDLAAGGGGNCELTEPGSAVVKHDVTIIGFTDLPSRLPQQSSQLYSTNLTNMMKLLCPESDGNINIDFDDVILRGMTVVKDAEITWPPPPIKVSAAPPVKPPVVEVVEDKKTSNTGKHIAMLVAAGIFGLVANYAPAEFLAHFTVFVLACFIGYQVVWNVSHSLHTPLMSVTNAISGIIVVGALLQISSDNPIIWGIAAFATLIATINIVGGFVVTQRMLKMFRR
ncbi:MAG: NAD(P)(+) transhydrogenase (Re/Si-specific) subunit alpha [Gammaproteobacteria bacterium]|nr:MAG: NAD(P)(+) transhydrogenase (Re/Si-specific) subunit alpha [Gammaproteobacteria bacterium]